MITAANHHHHHHQMQHFNTEFTAVFTIDCA